VSGLVLTPEQQAVVTAPLASLRVAAGAGTGKTTTVAFRVVELVRGHGIEPEQILGITFTNKAAEELADRIRTALADTVEPGREVEIHTYHGFAQAILREFGPLVGVERHAQVVTPAFSRRMIRAILDTVEPAALDVTLPRAVEKVRRLGAGLADHLVEPADVLVPADPDEVWRERIDLLEVLRLYEAEKERLGVADFGDLILRAHRVASRFPEVAATLRARYRAVVLDEYQDTNPAQRELLRVLFSGRLPVLAVGDADQTIYEWRGASRENLAEFPAHFSDPEGPARTLHLTANRRSGPEILALANAVRGRIGDADGERLRPVEGAPPARVTTAWLGTATEEADWIAGRILELADRRWADTAVLFRKNKDMLLVHDALSRHGIPYEVANLGGLLTVPEVADVHAWLRVLDEPADGPAVARILLGSRFRLGLADLAPLARWVRAGEAEARSEEEGVPGFTVLEALDHLGELDLRSEARAALAQFEEEYRRLVVQAQGLSLVELCRAVLDVTGAWGDVEAMEPAGGLSARLNLYRFLDLAEEWSPLEGRPSLRAFLGHLAAMEEEGGEELDTARLSDADAVTLITVHRAKGLEWPVVFLPAVAKDNFPARSQGFDNPLASAQFVPYELRLDRAHLPRLDAVLDERRQRDLLRPLHERQEWRIAYVAVTRAKEQIFMSGASWYGHPEPTQKPAVPSELFVLAADHDPTARPLPEPPPRPDSLGFRPSSGPAPDPLFEGGWEDGLRSAIDDPGWAQARAAEMGILPAYHAAVTAHHQTLFGLPDRPAAPAEPRVETSATGLVTYAACPKRYYWSEVDRLPRRGSAAARRGVDVHRRIELHHAGVVPLEEVTESLYDVGPGDSLETDTGAPDPFRVFLESRFARERPTLIEAPFTLALAGGVWVRGRIDAVYDRDGHWEVVDFKSGRAREDGASLVQLQTYAVAVHDVPFAGGPPGSVSVTFAFLGGGLEERSHPVDAAWLETARTRLAALAAGIGAGRWEPVPSPACRSCDFLRFCPAGRESVAG
jgi:DNA helicase-2/ATP-dependent DNA helicase PcrA